MRGIIICNRLTVREINRHLRDRCKVYANWGVAPGPYLTREIKAARTKRGVSEIFAGNEWLPLADVDGSFTIHP